MLNQQEDIFPVVAVIIPAKNEQANIASCIKAIRAQDYPQEQIQIIVVDNGSTDATTTIAKDLGATVMVDATASIAKLRNIGAAQSHSELIAFLDADMIAGPQWLKQSATALMKDAIGAIGGTLRIPENPSWVESTWCMPRFFRPDVFQTPWLPSGNLVLRRALFSEIDGFDASLTTCEDVDLCARIRATGRELYILDQAWVIHTGESKTLNQFFKKEIWRGKNHLQRSLNGFENWREALSLALPVAQLIFLISIPIALLFGSISYALIFAALAQILPLLRAIMVAKRAGRAAILPQLLIVWSTYYFARSVAILLSLTTVFSRTFHL